MKTMIMTTLVVALSASTHIYAGNNTPGIDKRQKNQQHRIVQGVASGELTKKESHKLMKGQNQLNRMEARAKSDGVVTRKERARIQQKANKESLKIKRNKSDQQKRAKAID